MTNHGERIKHPKSRGEWAELCFMMRAAERGLLVSKPWGETAHYDFVVESHRKFTRVQVKSTTSRRGHGYACKIRDCHGHAYQGDPFDFVAAYLILEDIWYIIPAPRLRGREEVVLYPRNERSKYDRYREAWHLLRGGRVGRVHSIEASCEDYRRTGLMPILALTDEIQELCPVRPPEPISRVCETSSEYRTQSLSP